MKIVAEVRNSEGRNSINLRTDDSTHALSIPPKSTGFGSGVNGGELLFLALATCYCNDLYREAAQRGIRVVSIDVTVEGDFGKAGEPARNVVYGAKVCAEANESEIVNLMKHTDTVAEIQNTMRSGIPVRLGSMEAKSLLE
jgi:organic hydroperoxide reductase OsmC/OhrA